MTSTATTPTFSHRSFAGLFLLGLVVVAVWASLSGTSNGDVQILPCPVKWVVGMDCPGCGITRASVAFTRGQFHEAWSFHPFAFLLIPLALAFWISPTRTKGIWGSVPDRARIILFVALVIASFGRWALRTPWDQLS